MRAKLKSELLSFEAIVLYVVVGLVIVFGVTMYTLLQHDEKNAKDNQKEEQHVTTELKEETTGCKDVKDDKEEKDATVKSTKSTKQDVNTTKVTEDAEKEVTTVEEPPELVSLGEFRLTAYCKCSTCCGKWAGSPTASGAEPKANHTIAVDTSVIPFGTKVMINGNTYTAEDTGSAIKGNRIDIYMNSHSEAMNFGVQYKEVFVVNH